MITNEWLAGFIDGEGSFNITAALHPQYRYDIHMQTVFKLSIVDSKGIIPKIATHLKKQGISSYQTTKKPINKNAQMTTCCEVTNKVSCKRFYELFYPLLLVKKEECKIWGKFIDMYLAKEHLTPLGILNAMKLKEQLQSLRSPRGRRKYTYDWVESYLVKKGYL